MMAILVMYHTTECNSADNLAADGPRWRLFEQRKTGQPSKTLFDVGVVWTLQGGIECDEKFRMAA